ncbi:hypothetical protein [Orrella dioscoreae]|uniref:Uncharacterized protein n=1 Tax=Orrella dioscoreae TaxID=1851544 RepID=A0A1C3K377_9BURK|nr:hypothetical protein [Orrella dioscoreae]SBT25956.1 hypothetical protein ODI_01764 [Orrella dioscoreae]SOE50898.1 hypothetical protein ODI_R3047 [Orrella dioscoreae]
MKAHPSSTSLAELSKAHAAANLRGTLDDALQSPLLARCLAITAEALATMPIHTSHRSQSRTSTASVRAVSTTSPRHDVKRTSAGDKDD